MMLIKGWFFITIMVESLQDDIFSNLLSYSSDIPDQVLSQNETADSILILGVKYFFCFYVELYFYVLSKRLIKTFFYLLAELF